MTKGSPMPYRLDDDPIVIALRAQVAALEQENHDLLENLSLCKGNELAQQVADLTAQLATAQARIEELEQELKQFKGIFGDYDESSRTIEQAQIIWNMLKTQCADAQAEIEDWRSKLQRALTP